jgi:hypothetical protein
VNRYVILVPEEYDQYEVDVPYPLVADKLREDIVADIRAWYDGLPAATRDGEEGRKGYENLGKFYQVPGSMPGARLQPIHMEETDSQRPPYVYRFKPPTILTVDEWFAEAGR